MVEEAGMRRRNRSLPRHRQVKKPGRSAGFLPGQSIVYVNAQKIYRREITSPCKCPGAVRQIHAEIETGDEEQRGPQIVGTRAR